jgi:hypothetical protein
MKPVDVVNHIAQTTVLLIDVRTNSPQETTVFIPPTGQ